jgi:type VI secretion system protein ImpJ
MSFGGVHWHEGKFLRPHQFQLAERWASRIIHQNARWGSPYYWGLRAIEIDLEALANYRLVVRSLQARLRDGTMIVVPEDGLLPDVDLRDVLMRDDRVTIFVGLPMLHPGRPNVATDGATEGHRYRVHTIETEDENSGSNPQTVQVRRLNLRLLFSSQALEGYEVLAIARIEKDRAGPAVPRLDKTYIPPVLACDAWRLLSANVLEALYHQIGQKVEILAQQVVSRDITLDSREPGDVQVINRLCVLNEAYALLGPLVYAPGAHPWWVYLELCRLVGQLAIFGVSRRPPESPRYDHDDLAQCFFQVKAHLEMLLGAVVEPHYAERPFIGAGQHMQVALDRPWLEPAWRLFLGVQSALSTEECIRLVTRLDMKVGSAEGVDEIFRQGAPGVRYTHSPPRVLPQAQGLVYFQINREPPSEWQRIEQSLTLAVRLSEVGILGDIQGQRVLRVKSGAQITTMQLTLYAVPGAR